MKSIDKTYLLPRAAAGRQSSRPIRSPGQIMATFLRRFLRSGLYLAAILIVPGALIGAPILWWISHRRKAAATGVDSMFLTQRCQQPWRRLGADYQQPLSKG
jgi:hypothetical protein